MKRIMKRVTKIQESELWIDGEFLSEEDMLEANFRPSLGAQTIHAAGWHVAFSCCKLRVFKSCRCSGPGLLLSRQSACSTVGGFGSSATSFHKPAQRVCRCVIMRPRPNLRRDRYEKHIKLYWVQRKIAGRLL